MERLGRGSEPRAAARARNGQVRAGAGGSRSCAGGTECLGFRLLRTAPPTRPSVHTAASNTAAQAAQAATSSCSSGRALPSRRPARRLTCFDQQPGCVLGSSLASPLSCATAARHSRRNRRPLLAAACAPARAAPPSVVGGRRASGGARARARRAHEAARHTHVAQREAAASRAARTWHVPRSATRASAARAPRSCCGPAGSP